MEGENDTLDVDVLIAVNIQYFDKMLINHPWATISIKN